ncbi:unnamed protein product [Sphagnum troendelagicum]|uniref:Uncharacterized protein n=1 Tax=Sphagnum troendelagicum TaxID=128251 RepID=A0ABP0UWI3_9BRYO
MFNSLPWRFSASLPVFYYLLRRKCKGHFAGACNSMYAEVSTLDVDDKRRGGALGGLGLPQRTSHLFAWNHVHHLIVDGSLTGLLEEQQFQKIDALLGGL